MGGRGKPLERERARALRVEGWTLAAIAAETQTSKGMVSVWVRDITVSNTRPLRSRTAARFRAPNALEGAKAKEIATMLDAGRDRIGGLSERDLLIAGTALYAGEGSKRDRCVCFSNTDARMVELFCAWLHRFFEIDESRLRVRLYLHEGHDLSAAIAFWSEVTGIPPTQFRTPYRAVADSSRRATKHPMGVASVIYACSKTHRGVMGLVTGLLTSKPIPG